jgi:propanol-preferring alcohol dehydrogenase
VVLLAPRAPIEIVEVPVAPPGTGEVLVRMEACGICHSDLFVAGLEKLPLAPLVLGHEGIGRVVEAGDNVDRFTPGDRVGITFLASTCGACELCLSGRERFCARQRNFGFTVPGALRSYATLPAACLARVPDSLDALEAAPLCCAGWTAFGALRETGLAPGQTVGIFGLGGLGHLAARYAVERGLSVAAIDPLPAKREMALTLGAELALPPEGSGRTLQKRGGLDAALVLTAAPESIQEAFRSLKRNGTLVVVGLSPGTLDIPVVDAVLKGIIVRGSYLGSREDLDTVFALAASGSVRAHVEPHKLWDTPQILEQMRAGELVGRAVIAFS